MKSLRPHTQAELSLRRETMLQSAITFAERLAPVIQTNPREAARQLDTWIRAQCEKHNFDVNRFAVASRLMLGASFIQKLDPEKAEAVLKEMNSVSIDFPKTPSDPLSHGVVRYMRSDSFHPREGIFDVIPGAGVILWTNRPARTRPTPHSDGSRFLN